MALARDSARAALAGRRALVGTAVLAILIAIGCPNTGDDGLGRGQLGASCAADTDCSGTLVCSAGTCQPAATPTDTGSGDTTPGDSIAVETTTADDGATTDDSVPGDAPAPT